MIERDFLLQKVEEYQRAAEDHRQKSAQELKLAHANDGAALAYQEMLKRFDAPPKTTVEIKDVIDQIENGAGE